MTYVKYLLIFLLIILLFAGCSKKQAINLAPGVYAEMETSKGLIIIQLEYQKVPMLVANFIGLADGTFLNEQEGEPGFFDNSSFFDIARDILIKGGEPKNQKKRRPGYNLPNNVHPDLMHNRVGAISMLESESKISANQFSISLKPVPWLDYKEPVFGYVVYGIENLQAINQGDILKKVTILKIGDEAADFIVTQQFFDTLRAEVEAKIKESGQELTNEVIGSLKKTYPDLTKTTEGIWFTILKQGAGASPSLGTEVLVKYQGTLLDGTVIMDTATEENGTKKLILGQVIKGLNGALLTMKKGEERIVVIPPELGFGEAGLAPLIPQNAFLIFNVELIDF